MKKLNYDNPQHLPSIIKSIIRLYMYWRSTTLRISENRRRKTLENTINTLIQEYNGILDIVETPGFRIKQDTIDIFNVSLYALMIDYDLSILNNNMIKQIDKWNQKCYAKQIAVMMYEATDDFLELFGKKFRHAIKELPDSETLTQELNDIVSLINMFKKRNHKKLHEIRNYVGAHRDLNAFNQIEVLNSINLKDTIDLYSEFMMPVKKMAPYFVKVMQSISHRNQQLSRLVNSQREHLNSIKID